MMVRLLGGAWLLLGLLASPFVLSLFFNAAHESMSEFEKLAQAGIFCSGALLAFFVAPVATAVSSSGVVGKKEENFAQIVFVACAILCPLLQISGELVRGPWHGILGFLWRASIGNGLWFSILAGIHHVRRRKPESVPGMVPSNR